MTIKETKEYLISLINKLDEFDENKEIVIAINAEDGTHYKDFNEFVLESYYENVGLRLEL